MKNFLFITIIVIFSLLLVKPLFYDGFYPMHDNTQITRVFEMKEALLDGMFPVRWVDNLGYGYGYPIFTYYAPFAYYIGGIIALFFQNAVIGTKAMIILGTILSGITMYFLAREFWREKGGLVAGILYTFAPYHALNLYVRGAIAELWAYVFLPLVFLGLWRIYKRNSWGSVILTSLSLAGVILSHNLTALMLLPFISTVLILLIIMSFRKDKRISMFLIISFLLGVLISAFYWLPALTQLELTNVRSQISGTGTYFSEHYVCLPQLWSSPWGFAGSTEGCLDGMSFQIGKIHIGMVFLGIILAFFMRKRQESKIIVYAGTGLLLSLFLTLEVSSFIWNSVSFLSFIQFPWRFLSFIILFSSFIAGFVIYCFEELFSLKKTVWIGVLGILIITTIYYGKLFVPQNIVQDEEKASDPQYIREVVSRISDEYLPSNFERPHVGSSAGNLFPSYISVSATILKNNASEKTANVKSTEKQQYTMNLAFSPAWKVTIQEKRVTTENKGGRLSFQIPSGDMVIKVAYVETIMEKAGNTLSIIGILLTGLGILLFKGKKKK